MSADRNLLFGILAVQLDFVDRDALIDAMSAWLLDKSQPLGDILRDRGHLSPARRQLLDALVDEHLRQHGDDPRQSLSAVASVEPALRQSLATIADDEVRTSLSHAGWRAPQATIDGPRSSAGRYEILRPHAKGGLGEVYVAEDTELHRPVALKEIRPQFADDAASRGRFVLEAEITGGLEHPGIVPVYGLGAYPDGRPYYAMRFIKGDTFKESIGRFHALPSGGRQPPETSESQGANAPRSPDFASLQFRELLGRFVDVCNAVAYAHSRGVLHRDLKPVNVMLGPFGETLVVDWGLAKATGRAGSVSDRSGTPTLRPHSGGGSSATEMGQALGTPAYMSPEQAAGRLDDLGPPTDVYGLGATLYEVLAGRPPFVAADLGAVEAGQFPPPGQVRPGVPPALEAVCLKAMALRPDDRYTGATALAQDVERFLADEPVTAYPEPAGARLRRWARRHARLVVGLAAALTVGVLALAAVAWQSERARRAIAVKEAETARQRDVAREQKVRTRAALDTMTSTEMIERLGSQKALTAGQRAFLQSALGYYKEFAAEAATEEAGRKLEADAHFRVGQLLKALGQQAEAEAAFRAARTMRERLATDHPTVAQYRSDLAASRGALGTLLVDLGRPAEAETAYRAALAVEGRLAADYPAVPDYRRELAGTHNNLGTLFLALGRWGDAEAAFRAALAEQERLAADHPAAADYRRDLGQSYNSLGALLRTVGRRAEAEAAFRAALAVRERLATDFPTVPQYRSDRASSRSNLGVLLGELGRREESAAAFRTALAERERLAADYPGVPEYRRELAASHNNLGLLLNALGRQPEAVAAFRAALEVQQRLAADHPGVPEYRSELGRSHNNLAALHRALGKPAEAEAAYRAAVAVQERLVADHPAVPEYRRELSHSQNNLGLLLNALGRRPEAIAAFRAALALRETLVADHPNVPTYRDERDATSLTLSGLLIADGKVAAAVAIADRIAGSPAPSADNLYNCACVFALSTAAASNPDATTHAARAVELLRQAVAAGYRDVPNLLKDSDLAALRRRDDFAGLLWDLADGPPAK